MNSKFFNLDWKDIGRGVVMAILGAFVLPVLAALQTPGFDIFHADWNGILILAVNGGLGAGAAYLLKNLFSTSDGKFGGVI